MDATAKVLLGRQVTRNRLLTVVLVIAATVNVAVVATVALIASGSKGFGAAVFGVVVVLPWASGFSPRRRTPSSAASKHPRCSRRGSVRS